MKQTICASLVFLSAGCGLASAGPASDAVMPFYALPLGTVVDPALRDRFVDPALTKLQQDDAASKEGTEVGCIDFALQLDAQDMDEAHVAQTLKLSESVDGETATVTARFSLFADQSDSEREVVWSLKKSGVDWKIADIAAPANNWRLSEFDCGG